MAHVGLQFAHLKGIEVLQWYTVGMRYTVPNNMEPPI